MKRKQISALLLSSTLIVSNVTPTLAAAVQGSVATMSTQETTETSADSDLLDEMQENLSESPETIPEATTTLETDVGPEVTPEVEEEITPENTPEMTPETTPEVTPEAETIPETPVADDTVAENPATVPPEEVVKPEIGEWFKLEFSNFELTCEVTGENTVDVVELSTLVAYEDCTNVTIPATVTYGDIEYKVVNLREMHFLDGIKNLVISEGIEKISYTFPTWHVFDSITLPSTLKEIRMDSSLADGTRYLNCKNWGVVNLPESNPYLRYDADKHRIFSKIEEVGPELAVGDTFEKDVCVYKVVEPGVVDVVDFFQSSDTNVCDIPGVVRYKGHDYKVRDCHIEGYDNDLRYFVRLSLGEGIRNVYWGYDPNISSDAEIKELVYPSTLESIDYTPSLPKLESITIPDSNPHYKTEDGVLFNKDMTELLMYPASKVADVYTVPASVTTIKMGAFIHTRNTKELIISDTVKTLEEVAIVYTKGVEKITVGSGIEHIGPNFYYCTGLKTAVIKMNISYPGRFFGDCTDLEDIYIEGNPKNLGYRAFVGLTSLKAYHVSGCDWLSAEDGVLYSKNGEILSAYPANKDDAMFVVPDKVEVILPGAFTGTKNLKTLIMPKGAELYSGVVENPVNPMDVYLRDTESIKVNGTTPLFVSEVGGNVYVPSHKVLEQIKNANLSNGMEVSEKFIKIDSIELDQWSIQPVKGTSTKINATFAPYYATEPLKWHSEDESVATVDQDGNITAHKAGQTRIVVSTQAVARAISVTVKVPLESISLNKESLHLNKGKSEVLQVSYNPEDTTDSKEVTWESSNDAIVSVDETGKITGIASGTAMITATGANGTKATCEVTVKSPLTSIEIIGNKTELNRGNTLDLDIKYNPDDTTDSKEIAWSVSNNKILSVNAEGVVTAKGVGKAFVYAKGANNVMASYEITVKAPLESISLDKTEMTLTEGTSSKLLVNYNPMDTTDSKDVVWNTDAKDIVSVDEDGNVTAHKRGTATITAKVGEKTAVCKVTVTKKAIALDSIEITTPNVSLTEEEISTLQVVYNPTDTTVDRTVTWSSSNNDVASVDKNGNVTAHKAGEAIITAKVGNKTATCKVTVKRKEIALESIAMNLTTMVIKENCKGELTVSYNPTNTTVDRTVTWTSSDSNIASVDKNGVVTGHKVGVVTITAKVGNKTATCVVTVEKNTDIALESIALNKTELKFKVNDSDTLKLSYNPTNTTVDRTVTWTSSNKDIASVDKNGKVIAKRPGKATIAAKVAGKTATCTVTVAKMNLEDAEISLSKNIFDYNGKAHKPSVTVKYDGKEISDYLISYSNNVNAGTAKIKITGKGDATGTRELTFTIQKANIQNAEVSGIKNKIFNGAAQTQNITVSVHGRTLGSSDYIVSYKNNVQPGTATMTITGKENYTGSKQFTYKVNMKAGWTQIGSTWYYGNSDGSMVKDGWVGNYYMDKNGVWVPGAQRPQWIKSGNRWWYRHMDGGYTRSNWELINGKWYYFDASGWMQTGWQFVRGRWYYMDASGAMLTGWQFINHKWYYLNSSGAMQTGWVYVGNKWYYLNHSGAMLTGWQMINGRWYYMNGSGAMLTGWQYISGKWYYMNTSGAMLTGWQKIDGRWYLLSGSGAMLTGWQKVNGTWYYMYSNGAMAENTWVGNYYVNASGAWIKSR